MLNINTLSAMAVHLAKKSSYKYRMSAIIFSKNRVISTGFNKNQVHHRKLHPKFKKWPASIHAEAAAILNAKADLKGTSIFVCRIYANDTLALAKPCAHCLAYLMYTGIKHIYYTTGNVDKPIETIKLR